VARATAAAAPDNGSGTRRANVRFAPARPRRAFDEIIDQVRDMIRQGDLQPGDRLPSERALAEQLGVSRNTVREALRMIEIAGLITLRKGATGGAFITAHDPTSVAESMSNLLQLTRASLADITEARVMIESMVVRVACERATAEDLDLLEKNVDEAARLTEAEDWMQKALVNEEFHQLLAAATQNPVLITVVGTLSKLTHDVMLAVGPMENDFMVRSRRTLLRHLKARDADRAEAELVRNLKRLHKLWLVGDYPGAHGKPSR
jgi:GntR family transcriptional repressor for pyruvate dehydrogenase complex